MSSKSSKFIILAGLLFFLSAMPACCEYYQYTDKNGIKHFTDNLAEVPESQRKKLSIHQSTQSTQSILNPQEKAPAPPENLITPESLAIEKDALDNEYNRLLKQRQSLNEQKQDIGEKKFNELAGELNQNIQQYQARSDAFEKKIIEYNKQTSSVPKEPVNPENNAENPEE